MAKKEPRPQGVMCYWEYIPIPPDHPHDPERLWKLVESFPIDGDGYPLARNLTLGEEYLADQWQGWMYTGNREEILGRAVTMWYVESGVELLDLHPPEWVPWLSVSFVEELKKLPNWWEFLQCGHNLYLGTARAAEKIIFKE